MTKNSILIALGMTTLLVIFSFLGCRDDTPARPTRVSEPPEIKYFDSSKGGAPPLPPTQESGQPSNATTIGAEDFAQAQDAQRKSPSVSVKAYFDFKRDAIFRIQLPQALNLYKAQHGKLPKSIEELEQKVLKPNNLKLPELPAGHKYVYVDEELRVQLPPGSQVDPEQEP